MQHRRGADLHGPQRAWRRGRHRRQGRQVRLRRLGRKRHEQPHAPVAAEVSAEYALLPRDDHPRRRRAQQYHHLWRRIRNPLGRRGRQANPAQLRRPSSPAAPRASSTRWACSANRSSLASAPLETTPPPPPAAPSTAITRARSSARAADCWSSRNWSAPRPRREDLRGSRRLWRQLRPRRHRRHDAQRRLARPGHPRRPARRQGRRPADRRHCRAWHRRARRGPPGGRRLRTALGARAVSAPAVSHTGADGSLFAGAGGVSLALAALMVRRQPCRPPPHSPRATPAARWGLPPPREKPKSATSPAVRSPPAGSLPP